MVWRLGTIWRMKLQFQVGIWVGVAALGLSACGGEGGAVEFESPEQYLEALIEAVPEACDETGDENLSEIEVGSRSAVAGDCIVGDWSGSVTREYVLGLANDPTVKQTFVLHEDFYIDLQWQPPQDVVDDVLEFVGGDAEFVGTFSGN